MIHRHNVPASDWKEKQNNFQDAEVVVDPGDNSAVHPVVEEESYADDIPYGLVAVVLPVHRDPSWAFEDVASSVKKRR